MGTCYYEHPSSLDESSGSDFVDIMRKYASYEIWEIILPACVMKAFGSDGQIAERSNTLKQRCSVEEDELTRIEG